MSRGQRGKCQSGKVRYRDDQEAKHALGHIRVTPEQRSKTPRRIYECDWCNGWHLTSQPLTRDEE